MTAANLLVAAENGPLRHDALASLQALAQRCMVEERNPRDWPGLIGHIAASAPEILLFELRSAPDDLASALREIRACAPGIRIVVANENDDPQSILSAMRAGANEFVFPPFGETLVPALQRILSAQEQEKRAGQRGLIIGFLSAKGGCGATTLACHVATDLRRQTQKKIALADLDFASGMVAFLTKVQSSYSILDAAKNLSRLDESLWKDMVPEWKPGLTVVPAPESLSVDEDLNLSDLCNVIRFMRTQYDWIVLDLGRSFTRLVSAIYDDLDQLLVVSVMEVAALQALRRIVNKLEDRRVSLEKLKLVLNRTPKTMDLSREELEKIISRPLFASLPNDYPSLYQSYSEGNLLAPTTRLGQTFSALTANIAGIKPAPQKKKFALFG